MVDEDRSYSHSAGVDDTFSQSLPADSCDMVKLTAAKLTDSMGLCIGAVREATRCVNRPEPFSIVVLIWKIPYSGYAV